MKKLAVNRIRKGFFSIISVNMQDTKIH